MRAYLVEPAVSQEESCGSARTDEPSKQRAKKADRSRMVLRKVLTRSILERENGNFNGWVNELTQIDIFWKRHQLKWAKIF